MEMDDLKLPVMTDEELNESTKFCHGCDYWSEQCEYNPEKRLTCITYKTAMQYFKETAQFQSRQTLQWVVKWLAGDCPHLHHSMAMKYKRRECTACFEELKKAGGEVDA